MLKWVMALHCGGREPVSWFWKSSLQGAQETQRANTLLDIITKPCVHGGVRCSLWRCCTGRPGAHARDA
jgi:hypothetical protein